MHEWETEDVERDEWLAECKAEHRQEWVDVKRDRAAAAARQAKRIACEEQEIADDHMGMDSKNVVAANVLNAARDLNSMCAMVHVNETEKGFRPGLQDYLQAALQDVMALLEKGSRTIDGEWLMYERLIETAGSITIKVLVGHRNVIKMYLDVQKQAGLLQDAALCAQATDEEDSQGEMTESDEETYKNMICTSDDVSFVWRSGRWQRVEEAATTEI
jgi:hypothetical protein